MEGGKSGGLNDSLGAAGANQLVADIIGYLGVRQAGEGVMDGNTLAQGLVDRFAQGVVEIRLAAEDEGKAVDGVIAVIHKHFNIIEDIRPCGNARKRQRDNRHAVLNKMIFTCRHRLGAHFLMECAP